MDSDQNIFQYILEELKEINKTLLSNGDKLSSQGTKIDNLTNTVNSHSTKIDKIEEELFLQKGLMVFLKRNWKVLIVIIVMAILFGHFIAFDSISFINIIQRVIK